MIKVKDGWVVGGDSLRRYDDGRTTITVCKIKEKDGTVLVTWGMANWEHATVKGVAVENLATLGQHILGNL